MSPLIKQLGKVVKEAIDKSPYALKAVLDEKCKIILWSIYKNGHVFLDFDNHNEAEDKFEELQHEFIAIKVTNALGFEIGELTSVDNAAGSR